MKMRSPLVSAGPKIEGHWSGFVAKPILPDETDWQDRLGKWRVSELEDSVTRAPKTGTIALPNAAILVAKRARHAPLQLT
jgi:hypothetical protein